MANTYTQIHIQIVFTVKHREHLIPEVHREELQKYITGIIQSDNHKVLAIYCMPDHIHVLIGLRPSMSISDVVRKMKSNSSKFINDNNWTEKRFEWQNGFGAFSYSNNHVSNVINYINDQKQHHEKTEYKTEYKNILDDNNIDYDTKYLFDI